MQALPKANSACCLIRAAFLFDLCFDPEDRSDSFLWKVGGLSPEYREEYSASTLIFVMGRMEAEEMSNRDWKLTRHWRTRHARLWQRPRGLVLCEVREEASRNSNHRKFMIMFQASLKNTKINWANMLKGWKTSYPHERSQFWSTEMKQNQRRKICKKMN